MATAALRGRGGALFFEGDPGIGKTRLLGACLDTAARIGMTTLAADATELEIRRPFGAIASCLGITPGTEDARRAGIARLLFREVPVQPETSFSGVGSDLELHLTEAMALLVEDLCARGPVAIAIDELQWADPSTLHVLHRLARTVGELALFLCGALRPAPRSGELTRLVRALPLTGATVRTLPPLEPPEVVDLLASAIGHAPDLRLVRQAGMARGNPFYVIQLAGARDALGSWDPAGSPDGNMPADVPPALKLTLLLEVASMSPDTQEVLRVASMLGSWFRVADLAVVLERSATALAPQLREALEGRVLREDGDGLAFRHDLLREALYDDVPRPLRMSMHLEIARALVGAGASALDVSEHVLRGASPGDVMAVEWLQRAADEAIERAPSTAAELYRRITELLDPGDPRRDALLADWALSLETSGRAGEAEAACVELLGRPQPPAAEAKLRLCLARRLHARGASVESRRQVVLAETVEGLPPAQRARVLGSASGLTMSGLLDLDLAESTASRGLALGQAHQDHMAMAMCALTLAWVAFERGRLAEALDRLRQLRVTEDPAPELRVMTGRRHLLASVQLVRCQVLHHCDRAEESRLALAGLRRSVPQLGMFGMLVGVQTLAVVHGLMLGGWDDAVTEYDALTDLCAELDQRPALLSFAAGARAMIGIHRGDWGSARAAIATSGAFESPHMTHWTALARALLAESSAGPAAALDALRPAWEAAIHGGTTIVYPQLAPDLIRLAHAGPERGRAVEACELVEALAAANPGATTIAGIALRCRGLLDGDPDALVEATSVLRDSPRPLERARAAEDAAVALVRRRQVAKAGDFLDEALRGYRQLAAEWDLTRATSRLRAAGVHRSGGGDARHNPVTGWDALTPSERAVVELVGQRMSNAEVAERLFLSVHTVKRHLANARVKLGPASRADLARSGPRAEA